MGGPKNGWWRRNLQHELCRPMPTAMSLPAFIHRPIIAALAFTLLAQFWYQAAFAAGVLVLRRGVAVEVVLECFAEVFLAA